MPLRAVRSEPDKYFSLFFDWVGFTDGAIREFNAERRIIRLRTDTLEDFSQCQSCDHLPPSACRSSWARRRLYQFAPAARLRLRQRPLRFSQASTNTLGLLVILDFPKPASMAADMRNQGRSSPTPALSIACRAITRGFEMQ
jgi:hypothetical protein